MFVQVFGDLRVVSYWIDTLVLKTEGNTYATLLHHPFLFKGKPTQCSRGGKKDFWRRCRGGLRSSQDIPSTHHKLISLAFTLFSICLSFSSPPLHPCRFICPLFPNLSLSLSLVFLCACLPLWLCLKTPTFILEGWKRLNRTLEVL